MKVIVCGAGQVGFNIARHLANQGNDVVVIDRSPKLVQKIMESLDVQALEGYASDPDLLETAGARDTDMIVAVTLSDEVNMVACQVAHSLFDVPTKIARVRNQSYLNPVWQDLFSRDHMPIDVIISPEVEVARTIHRRLEVPGAFEVIPFADGKVRVVGVHLTETCPILDTPLRQLTELFPEMHITVLAIVREEKLFVPSGDEPMLIGDSVYFAVEEAHLDRAMTVFGHEEKEAHRIIIVGAGNVGLFLARELEKSPRSTNVKIIERDTKRAEFAAARLSKCLVINGDALESEILKEANAQAAETFVAVANDDEVNILSSLLAKRIGTERVVALVSNPVYSSLLGSLGIDVYVDPRETTFSTIIQHIRRGRILALHTVRGGEAEIIEAEALDTSPLVGKAIRDMKLPEGIMIGAIVRDGEVLIPRGDTAFETGDRVVLLTQAREAKKIEQMFSVRLEYF